MNNCVICQAEYLPKYKAQVTCLHEVCKSEHKRQGSIKRAKKSEIRAKRGELMTHGDCVKEVDKWFSKYVRLRDSALPCICCDVPLLSAGDIPTLGGDFDAGHYVSRRHMATRWDEVNVNGQRKYCNRYKGGNLVGYRQGLVRRYGIEEVERLESLEKTTRKYTKDELIALRDYYKQKFNELKGQ